MSKQEITTENAPAAIGPYAQGIRTDGLIFVSGQIPVDPASGAIPSTVEGQAKQTLENLGAVLKEAGADFEQVVKTTVFIKNMADFTAVNEIYDLYFSKPYPARSCVEVSALPKGVLLEIEAVASV